MEALVAIVVFSIAVAGAFGLVANAVRANGNAVARAQATALAESTLARMLTGDITTVAERYGAAGSDFQALLADAAQLPGVTRTANAPRVTFAPGPSIGSRRASITLSWQLASETVPHHTSLSTILAR
jgi:Tfp pilus assembly protein PilV